MADIERLTITLPSDMAAAIKGAVNGGDYASTSEVVRDALRDWKMKRALQLQELAALKAVDRKRSGSQARDIAPHVEPVTDTSRPPADPGSARIAPPD